jgi:hypothetical protein
MHDTARCLGYPSDSSRAAREWARETSCGRHRCGPVGPSGVRRRALHLRSRPVLRTSWPVRRHSLPVWWYPPDSSRAAREWARETSCGRHRCGPVGPAGSDAAPFTFALGLCGAPPGLCGFTTCPCGSLPARVAYLPACAASLSRSLPVCRASLFWPATTRRRALPTSHWPWAVCRAARRRTG